MACRLEILGGTGISGVVGDPPRIISTNRKEPSKERRTNSL